ALAGRRGQVDGEAALGPVFDDVRIVVVARGIARAAHAVDVAGGRLDLDDVRAEVGHHGRRDRPRDEVRRVDDADAVQQPRHLFIDREELDFEDQRRARWDDAARAAIAVPQVRRDDELALAADLHGPDALVPALGHAAL